MVRVPVVVLTNAAPPLSWPRFDSVPAANVDVTAVGEAAPMLCPVMSREAPFSVSDVVIKPVDEPTVMSPFSVRAALEPNERTEDAELLARAVADPMLMLPSVRAADPEAAN